MREGVRTPSPRLRRQGLSDGSAEPYDIHITDPHQFSRRRLPPAPAGEVDDTKCHGGGLRTSPCAHTQSPPPRRREVSLESSTMTVFN